MTRVELTLIEQGTNAGGGEGGGGAVKTKVCTGRYKFLYWSTRSAAGPQQSAVSRVGRGTLGVFEAVAFGKATLIRTLEEHNRSTAFGLKGLAIPNPAKTQHARFAFRDEIKFTHTRSSENGDNGENGRDANRPRVLLLKERVQGTPM